MAKRIILAGPLLAALVGFLLLFAAGNENSGADLLYQNTVQPPLPLCVCATLTPSPVYTSAVTPTPIPPSPSPTMTTIPLPTTTPLPTPTSFTFPTPTQEVGLNPTSAPATITWRVAVTAGVVTHSWDGARFIRRTQALPYLTEFVVDTSQAGWCRLDSTINVYRVRTQSDVWIPWRDYRLGMVYAAPVSAEVCAG